MGELPLCCLNYAEQNDVGADSHERDVEVWGIHVLPWWLIPVASTYLHNSTLSGLLCHIQNYM